VKHAESILNNDIEEIEFEGNYMIQEDEISFVNLTLPDSITEVSTNSIGIPVLDLNNERIKTLFWYENKVTIPKFR